MPREIPAEEWDDLKEGTQLMHTTPSGLSRKVVVENHELVGMRFAFVEGKGGVGFGFAEERGDLIEELE